MSRRAEAGQLFERPCPNARPEGSESGHPSLVGSPELSVQIEQGGMGLTSGPLTHELSWALWQHQRWRPTLRLYAIPYSWMAPVWRWAEMMMG